MPTAIINQTEELANLLVTGDEIGALAILASNKDLANAKLTHPKFSSDFRSITAATLCECAQVVRSLLELGADVETEWEPERWRPLHFAAKKNLITIGRILLENGALVDCRDSRDKTPLFWCIVGRRFEFGEMLLESGAAIDQRWKGFSLLHHEAKDGKTKTVEFMLKHGADPNIRDGRVQLGSTPLHGAARQDRLNAAKVLVEHRADVNARTDHGQTPLDAALASKRQKLVPLLLEHGAKSGIRADHETRPS